MRCLIIAAALLAPALAAVAPRGLSAQRHAGGGGHTRSRGGGGGVPCGRSYISADKVCHVGALDAPARGPRRASDGAVDAAGASSAVPASTPSAPAKPVTYLDVITALDSNARARCTADSIDAAGAGRPRRPECAHPPAPFDPRTAEDSARRARLHTADAPVPLRAAPDEGAAVLATVPRGAVLDVSGCTTGARAWCLGSSYERHRGYFPRRFLLGEDAGAPASPIGVRRRARRAAGPGTSGGRHPGYYTGPRGGCYTYSASGRKQYVDHSYCS